MSATRATSARASVLRRAAYPLLAFTAVVAFGVGGFMAVADIGVLDASFWVIDPTSVELHFREHGTEAQERLAKAISVSTRVLLVLTGAWIAESVLSAAFGGSIKEELRKVQLKKEIEETDDHVVVCGYGMFGRTVANGLAKRDAPVVVVESETDEYERAVDDGHLAVNGDARREDVLTEAGTGRANRVVCAVDDSNVNIQTAVVVSQIAPDCRVVVRVGDEMYESLARRAGADDVVIPEVMSGESVTEGL
ncbi:MAG: voltage-gated potassium channel [Methanobacteriota archaeon]|jgi:voltage-gated potassium channel|uniref:NAD-binding protein n=1 Tax=Halorutilus salinus TaxID=2487751 RepID=A0A9Q4C5D1_9EURY|nr:NAD(P)-binding protein [Halorutilus salinus]MCX2818596.1 NAD-binding protein [Halorutilus salinus]